MSNELQARALEAETYIIDFEKRWPDKDFTRLRSLLRRVGAATTREDAIALMEQAEEESYLLGIPGFTQEHMDC